MKRFANILLKFLRTTQLLYKMQFELFIVVTAKEYFREIMWKLSLQSINVFESNVATSCDFIMDSFLKVPAPGVMWICVNLI